MKYYEMRGVFEFVRDDLQPKDSPEWKQYCKDMETLFNELEPYFTPDQNKQYKAISKEEYERISEIFDDAAKSGAKFLKNFKGDQTKKEDEFGHPYPGVKETMKNLNDEFFSKGFVEFKSITPDPHFSLKDQMEDFRFTNVQISNNEIKRLGGNQSTRLQMTVNLDGQDVKGVFTDMTHFSGKKDVSEVFTRVSEKYPKFKDFFGSINVDEFYKQGGYHSCSYSQLLSPDGNMIPFPEGQRLSAGNYLDKMKLDEATLAKGKALLGEPGFYEALLDFGSQMDDVATPTAINRTVLGMKENDRIDMRNSAMSGVANLLNCKDLIAKSRPLNIYDESGKKFKEGTFMEFAKGKDINNLAPVDEMRLLDPKDFETTDVKKQLADLQVLDYICGNVDRHGGNILYDVDPVSNKVVGIVGIDNDSSFGKRIPDNNKYNIRLPGINNLRVITDDMAKHVSDLTEGQLKATLHGYGLGEAEIEAAWKRTQILQQAIEKGQTYHELGNKLPEPDPNSTEPNITIIGEDKDWDKLSFKQLDGEVGNYYKTVQSISDLPKFAPGVDPFTHRRRNVAYVGLNNAMSSFQTGYLYDKAKAASPWFFTSTRYKNILSTLKDYHEAKMDGNNPLEGEKNQTKFAKLGALKNAIETYKSEKIRDGFIDDKWNFKKGVTGKDLDRILLVKDMETYVSRIEKEKKAFEDINKVYKDKKFKNQETIDFLTKPAEKQAKLVEAKLKKQGVDLQAERAKLKEKEQEQEAIPEVVVSNNISHNVSASNSELDTSSMQMKKAMEESELEQSIDMSEEKSEISKDIEDPSL